ncbi:AAA family ATPase [Oligoflexus tunisiensis]|uniref:AAA family ATPase n=1 Tax=Oligoflexus tunisiensis TaxID=708132 RepID=UPI001C4016D1
MILFLWGPRQVGKTSLLKETFPDTSFIQLLKSDEFALFQSYPERLRERVRRNTWKFVIIDEIQKVPSCLMKFICSLKTMVWSLGFVDRALERFVKAMQTFSEGVPCDMKCQAW